MKKAIIANIALVVLELIGLMMSIKDMGWGLFTYYTQDSNIFALISSVVYLVFALVAQKKKQEISPIAVALRYISSCLLMVTFLVVVFVLAPSMKNMGGYKIMLFYGTMLYHHTLCPLLSLFSFLVFERKSKLKRHWTLLALVPTVAYAIVAVILNLTRALVGPYPFLRVYEQSIWMSLLWAVIILGLSYAIARLCYYLNQR